MKTIEETIKYLRHLVKQEIELKEYLLNNLQVRDSQEHFHMEMLLEKILDWVKDGDEFNDSQELSHNQFVNEYGIRRYHCAHPRCKNPALRGSKFCLDHCKLS